MCTYILSIQTQHIQIIFFVDACLLFKTNSGVRTNTDEMMRMEELMLREQGMALMRAGHMMNTQASIINSFMRDRTTGERTKQCTYYTEQPVREQNYINMYTLYSLFSMV